ncbi:MAG: 4Fe-4S binding protein [Firmicutes bacterium]|nr:4Fe-4S binding protein [Bacillota bacterium]
MTRKVTEECIGCGACVDSCPVTAIVLNDKAEIDPDTCIDCGACESECPVSAIVEA